MTTIPQSGCQHLIPANPKAGSNFYFTPEQRRQSPACQGLQYGPQISSFYQVRSTVCFLWNF
jgi:hypothetical protein